MGVTALGAKEHSAREVCMWFASGLRVVCVWSACGLLSLAPPLPALHPLALARKDSEDTKSVELASTWMQGVLTTIASAEPPTSRENVLRLNWIDFAELGLSHSKQLDKLVGIMVNDISHHPLITRPSWFPPALRKKDMGSPESSLFARC